MLASGERLVKYYSYYIKSGDGRIVLRAHKHVRVLKRWALRLLHDPESGRWRRVTYSVMGQECLTSLLGGALSAGWVAL